MAPADRAARPASTMAALSEVAPATPTTTPAVETMPSLAPRTPARSQLSRLPDVRVVRLVAVVVRLDGRRLVGRRTSDMRGAPISGGRSVVQRGTGLPPIVASDLRGVTEGEAHLRLRPAAAETQGDMRAPRARMREDRDMSDIRDETGAVEDDLYRWMVAASPDGLWVFDEEGRTIFANARMAEMLGRDPDDMVGFSVFDAVDEVGKEQFRAPPRRARDHGRARRQPRVQPARRARQPLLGARVAHPARRRRGNASGLDAPRQRAQRPAQAARPARRGPVDRQDRQLGVGRRRRPGVVVRRALPHLRPRPRPTSPRPTRASSRASTPTTATACRDVVAAALESDGLVRVRRPGRPRRRRRSPGSAAGASSRATPRARAHPDGRHDPGHHREEGRRAGPRPRHGHGDRRQRGRDPRRGAARGPRSRWRGTRRGGPCWRPSSTPTAPSATPIRAAAGTESSTDAGRGRDGLRGPRRRRPCRSSSSPRRTGRPSSPCRSSTRGGSPASSSSTCAARAPPAESDAATIAQITALFARVADREWTAERLTRRATRRWRPRAPSPSSSRR